VVCAGPEDRSGLEQNLALGEIQPGLADIAPGGRAFFHGDGIAVAVGVFLNDNGICARGQGSSGKDAHGLACREAAIEEPTGRDFTDNSEINGNGSDISSTHCVSIHGGHSERRLGDAGGNIFGKHTAMGFRQGDLLTAHRRKIGENPLPCFGDGHEGLAHLDVPSVDWLCAICACGRTPIIQKISVASAA